MSDQEDTRPILLVTTVDIGDGLSGKIEIRQGDDPEDAARQFCEQHGLPESIVGPLALHIIDNIERGLEEGPHHGQASVPPSEGSLPPSLPESPLVQQPDSPLIEAFLPDDSPGVAGPEPVQPPHEQLHGQGQQQHYEQYDQDSPNAYSAPLPPLVPAYPPAVLGQTRSGGDLPLPRPASAPYPAAADDSQQVISGSLGIVPELRRPASVNGSYGAGASYGTGASYGAGASYGIGPRRQGPPSSAGSGGSRGSHGSGHNQAHDRLYADYFSKQTRLDEERRLRDLEVQLKMQQVHVTPVSQHLASHRNAEGYRNYGERLYVEGRLDAMRKEKEAERLKQLEEEEALSECVFKPEISRMAQTLKALEVEVGAGAAWNRLYQHRTTLAKRQERLETLKKEQEEEAVKECTFRPQINHKSKEMVQDRQAILRESGIPGYEQLFNESIRRRLKQESLRAQVPEEATFRPRINTSSVVLRKLMEGRSGGQEGGLVGGGGDVATRLLERGKRYQQKLEHARDVLHGKVDPTTGQPLFQPQTCRAPRFARNPEGQPIGEYLYSIQQEREQKMSQVLNSTKQRAVAEAGSTYVNKRSEKLVEKLKRERFRAIYDYLCRGARGGVLNLVEVVLDEGFMDTIDPEVRADIEYAAKQLQRFLAKRGAEFQDSADSAAGGTAAAPAASQGSAGQAPQPAYGNSHEGEVDCAGFHALMEEVLARTAGISRAYLLPMPAGRKKFEEPTFQPSIDPNSKLLATRRRPEHLPAYELLYKTAEEVEHKREQRKKVLERAAMSECVFNPKLQAKQLVKEGKALKLAATLSASRRQQDDDGSVVDQATPSCAAAAAASQRELEQFDHIERQIQDALVRLSLSGEAAMAATLSGAAREAAAGGGGAGGGGGGAGAPGVSQSIDYQALFESQEGPLGSMSQFNPMDGGDSPRGARRHATLEWCESGDDLVANVINRGEYEGLDLHAIASASIELPAGGPAAARQQQVALVPPSPAESAV